MLFPGGSEVKASASNEGDLGSIPESGGSPGEGIEPRSPSLEADALTSEPPGNNMIFHI